MPNISPITELIQGNAREVGRLTLKWRLAYRDRRPKKEVDERFRKLLQAVDEAVDRYYDHFR